MAAITLTVDVDDSRADETLRQLGTRLIAAGEALTGNQAEDAARFQVAGDAGQDAAPQTVASNEVPRLNPLNDEEQMRWYRFAIEQDDYRHWRSHDVRRLFATIAQMRSEFNAERAQLHNKINQERRGHRQATQDRNALQALRDSLHNPSVSTLQSLDLLIANLQRIRSGLSRQ